MLSLCVEVARLYRPGRNVKQHKAPGFGCDLHVDKVAHEIEADPGAKGLPAGLHAQSVKPGSNPADSNLDFQYGTCSEGLVVTSLVFTSSSLLWFRRASTRRFSAHCWSSATGTNLTCRP